MRVGFDLSILAPSRGRAAPPGVVRVARELTGALERRGGLEVVRLAPESGEDPRRWRRSELPRAVARLGLAGLHSFTSGFALRGPGARVQTIHELPWRHGVAENAGWRHRFWASAGTWRARRVLCPSEHVARDLAQSPFVARAKIRVVPWGVAAVFRDEPPAGQVDEGVLGRYRLGEEPFLLCLGAVRPKKNLAALLHGLAERRQRGSAPLRAIVTGGETAQLRSDLGLASKLGLGRWVSTIDELDEEDLPALLRLSSAVPVLSRSEGFGLPVLEALASGTPVLVPAGSAQAEVAGASGIAVDPDRPASVADGLERALAEREERRAPGVARARSFTWDGAAMRVEALWGELA